MNDRIYSGALTSTYKGSSLKTSPGICEGPLGDAFLTGLNNSKLYCAILNSVIYVECMYLYVVV